MIKKIKLDKKDMNFENTNLFGATHYDEVEKGKYHIYYSPHMCRPAEKVIYQGDEEYLSKRDLTKI